MTAFSTTVFGRRRLGRPASAPAPGGESAGASGAAPGFFRRLLARFGGRKRQRDAPLQLRPAKPFDSDATSSTPFNIDFKGLERKGFIGRPYVRRRLARDMRAMRHRLLNRMNAYRLGGQGDEVLADTVVMVTSCWPGEGKTFTAVNLALSLILEDSIDVLLVDGDIVRPSLHKMFNIDGGLGLVNYLADDGPNLAPYLWRAENGRLTLLPAGATGESNRTLIRSGAMTRFMKDVSNRYSERIVIIDTPPLLGGREAPLLANYADHILFVVECGRTSQSAVEDALDLLTTHDNVSLILNRCNEGDRLTSGGEGSYGYYRQQSSPVGNVAAASENG